MHLTFWYVLMHCAVECEKGLDAKIALLLLCLQRLSQVTIQTAVTSIYMLQLQVSNAGFWS